MRKKKWYWASVAAACMLLMTACGQGKSADETKQSAAKTAEQSAKGQAESKFKAERKNINLGLFTIYYPESWNYDEENKQKEDGYGQITFFDGKTREDSSCEVTVSATSEDAYSFRRNLDSAGINLSDYAEGKLKTVSIGNAEYTVTTPDDADNTLCRFRHEPSGISYSVNIKGDPENEKVKELLEGIWLELKDEGKKDAPWPWEGEPFVPALKQQMVGTYTIVPEYLPFENPQGTFEIMEHKFYKQGDKLFHLQGNKLDTYDYTSDGMKYLSTLKLEDEYEYISADPEGMLYLSQGIFEIIGVKGGQKAMQSTIDGDLAMHPSGKWGISFWVNSDTQKIKKKDGNLMAEPWILTGLNDDASRKGPFSMIDDLEVTDKHILVAGKIAAEEDNTKIIVYDCDGKQLLELGGKDISDQDNLGSITGMAETENGYVAIDGNMRKIQFWNKEGTHVGAIDAEAIFGTRYPWLEDMQLLEDGSILVMATQKRNDESANELMLFRLTGF